MFTYNIKFKPLFGIKISGTSRPPTPNIRNEAKEIVGNPAYLLSGRYGRKKRDSRNVQHKLF
jgi:hypothetical protein